MIYRFIYTLLLLVLITHIKAQQSNIDSLRHEIEIVNNDTIKIVLLSTITEAYIEIKPDSASYFAEKLLKLSQKLRFRLNEAFALDQIAYALLNLGNYPRSLQTFLLAYAIADDPKSEANILPEKYIDTKVFLKRPVTAHMLRLDILARVIHYIGILYETTRKTEKEVLYYLKAKQLTEEIGNRSELCTVYSTLGRAYISLKMFDSALICEKKAYELAMETGNKKYLGSILLNIGKIQSIRGNKQLAIDYFRMARAASFEQNYLRGVVVCNLTLADLLKDPEKRDSGFYYAHAALNVAQYQNVPSLLLRSYTVLVGLYKSIHNNDSIVKYQDLIIKMNDSIFNSKQAQEFESIDFDEQQRKQKIEIAKEASQNRFRIYSLIGGLVIFISVAIILWRISLQRRKTNILLLQQKNKIENALREVKDTQNLLIQSEKMASLGELTAGIAHEIQNPLNFVNNFSEVNTELIAEMQEEIDKGDIPEVKLIANNIKENEQKINYHGKRADAIVKGMLQHSRPGTTQKEHTDVNALADEHLRLAYLAMRAKDKAFNVTIETNYDKGIGKINIIPQDIGRVLINLYNNAFYAVAEKKKQQPEGYEPTITVTTKKLLEKIEIRVKDNGTGIPQKVVDKIFQPFFTTKPTGHGIGLGLSLAYDFVTKEHGGTIRVDTREGEFAEFIIHLPG
jgi:two-component system NtrC family sensor kinase